MKKLLSLLLCLMLLASVATAETLLDGSENRNITIKKAGLNEPEDGISPVTGRNLDELADEYYQTGFAGQAISGRYMPIIVQIDNADGGIGYKESTGEFTGYRAPWGAQYADVIYESPLRRDGDTRISFLFSDIMPDAAGPCRSARMFHAMLREEWDSGFVFYGQQSVPQANVPQFFKDTGATKKANGMLLFSGTDGTNGTNKPWKQYFTKYAKKKDLAPPHHMSANVAGLVSLIPADFEPANHTWLFTDDLPEGGDDAEEIYVNWGKSGSTVYSSIVAWDETDECYYRYMIDRKGKEHQYRTLVTSEDKAVDIYFNNVIVQFMEYKWPDVQVPIPTALGTGNADYFMGGKHYSGVWNRDTIEERTVFYDENGEEIRLQRGHTLIIVMDYLRPNCSVSYE